MKRFWLGSLFCLVTAMVAACGGGGGSPSPQTPITQKVVVANFQPAGVEIGQASFNGYSTSRSPRPETLRDPYGNPVVYNSILYVPDYGNNRILGFSTIPVSNNASADFVLGQPDLASSTPGVSASQMDGPQTVRIANGKMFVCDYGNNRITIWNSPPTISGASADIVVGQNGFGLSASSANRTGLYRPEDMTVAGNKLIVADSGNNRVLIWNSIPTTNNAPADVVLGQSNFTLHRQNDDNQDDVTDSAPSNRTLYYPTGLWSDGTRLVVADSHNNRVLIWNTIPTTNFVPADLVLGQADFTHNSRNDDNQDGTAEANPSARTLDFPYFLDSNGTQLVISDNNNHRILIWDTFPIGNFASADRVLGQGDFNHSASNDDNQDGATDGSPTSKTMHYPAGVFIFGSKLVVTDNGNSRVLIY